MRSRSRYLGLLALLASLVLAGACAEGGQDAETGEPAPTSATGLISSIDPAEGPVESFELTPQGDDPLRISIDPELDYGFDLQHLREHMDQALPVTVALDERDGTLFATSIEDA